MNLDITARRFALTDAIREYAERKLAGLEHLHHHITKAHVVIDHDDNHSARQFVVKVHLDIPGKPVNADVRGADAYEGIDLAADKIATQLRKVHDREIADVRAAAEDHGAALRVGRW